MLYPHIQPAPEVVLFYLASDGFTERLLSITYWVQVDYSYEAELRHRLPRAPRAENVHQYEGQLPAPLAEALRQLLHSPGLATLAERYPGWDDAGSELLVLRAGGQEIRVELEEPYGRPGQRGPAPTAAEAGLLALRAAFDDFGRVLYADALATAGR